MKLKYYLRGLGTGVLFATIVLFIAYSYRLSDAKLSDSEIKEKALELGMVYGEGETTTSQSGDESETTTVNPTTGNSENKTTEPSSEDRTTGDDEPTSEDGTTKDEEPSSEETTTDPSVTCVVTVTNRTISSDVARTLARAGIIEDAEEFNDYLCDNGYDSKIRNGKHTIVKGMTYKEIAEKITSRGE
ncbi:MAG: hypothetical protein IJP13_00290 [Lachnospiraceae bacterium]|nr:hypothetical protein [Lachnospiraceae bacterium]